MRWGDIWEEAAPASLTETSGEKARALALREAGTGCLQGLCSYVCVCVCVCVCV